MATPLPITAQSYWVHRAQEGKIYGTDPSFSAQQALHYMKPGNEVLEVGGAYGRNSIYFAQHSLQVTNIDLSATWVARAEQDKGALPVTNVCGNIFQYRPDKPFAALFSNFVLHFFTDRELHRLFNTLPALLNKDGVFINSWLSARDPYATIGYPGGIYLHCYTRAELEKIHRNNNLKIVTIFETIELETVNSTDRKTIFWFTAAQRL